MRSLNHTARAASDRQQHPLMGNLYLKPSGGTPYVQLGSVSDAWDVISVMSYGPDTDTGAVGFQACLCVVFHRARRSSHVRDSPPECTDHESEDDFKAAVSKKTAGGAIVQLHVGASGKYPSSSTATPRRTPT